MSPCLGVASFLRAFWIGRCEICCRPEPTDSSCEHWKELPKRFASTCQRDCGSFRFGDDGKPMCLHLKLKHPVHSDSVTATTPPTATTRGRCAVSPGQHVHRQHHQGRRSLPTPKRH